MENWGNSVTHRNHKKLKRLRLECDDNLDWSSQIEVKQQHREKGGEESKMASALRTRLT